MTGAQDFQIGVNPCVMKDGKLGLEVWTVPFIMKHVGLNT